MHSARMLWNGYTSMQGALRLRKFLGRTLQYKCIHDHSSTRTCTCTLLPVEGCVQVGVPNLRVSMKENSWCRRWREIAGDKCVGDCVLWRVETGVKQMPVVWSGHKMQVSVWVSESSDGWFERKAELRFTDSLLQKSTTDGRCWLTAAERMTDCVAECVQQWSGRGRTH